MTPARIEGTDRWTFKDDAALKKFLSINEECLGRPKGQNKTCNFRLSRNAVYRMRENLKLMLDSGFPSPTADASLQNVARDCICGQSPGHGNITQGLGNTRVSEEQWEYLYKEWNRWLWVAYLKENGVCWVHAEKAPPVLADQRAWKADLEELRNLVQGASEPPSGHSPDLDQNINLDSAEQAEMGKQDQQRGQFMRKLKRAVTFQPDSTKPSPVSSAIGSFKRKLIPTPKHPSESHRPKLERHNEVPKVPQFPHTESQQMSTADDVAKRGSRSTPSAKTPKAPANSQDDDLHFQMSQNRTPLSEYAHRPASPSSLGPLTPSDDVFSPSAGAYATPPTDYKPGSPRPFLRRSDARSKSRLEQSSPPPSPAADKANRRTGTASQGQKATHAYQTRGERPGPQTHNKFKANNNEDSPLVVDGQSDQSSRGDGDERREEQSDNDYNSIDVDKQDNKQNDMPLESISVNQSSRLHSLSVSGGLTGAKNGYPTPSRTPSPSRHDPELAGMEDRFSNIKLSDHALKWNNTSKKSDGKNFRVAEVKTRSDEYGVLTDIISRLEKPILEPKSRIHGYIYGFGSAETPGYIKIGASEDPTGRISRWCSQCNNNFSLLWKAEMYTSVYVFETIIHYHLHRYRRIDLRCATAKTNKKKNDTLDQESENDNMDKLIGTHNEWFQVHIETALEAIAFWQRFSETIPFDRGRLSSFWGKVIVDVSEEIGRLRSGKIKEPVQYFRGKVEAGLKQWYSTAPNGVVQEVNVSVRVLSEGANLKLEVVRQTDCGDEPITSAPIIFRKALGDVS